jgi:iron complex transport system permease protein
MSLSACERAAHAFLCGKRPSITKVSTGLGGACLTLLADIAVRILSTGTELKLGVVTALIGAPFFLLLIMKTQKELP